MPGVTPEMRSHPNSVDRAPILTDVSAAEEISTCLMSPIVAVAARLTVSSNGLPKISTSVRTESAGKETLVNSAFDATRTNEPTAVRDGALRVII